MHEPCASARTPNNLPFSNRAEEGYENALAKVLAKALDAELQYMWLPQRRGFVRNTLSAQRCDVMMEAPVGFHRAMTTRPYFRSSYVFVTRKDRKLELRSLDDPRLKTMQIGVQVIGDDYANTPPPLRSSDEGWLRTCAVTPCTVTTAAQLRFCQSSTPWSTAMWTWRSCGGRWPVTSRRSRKYRSSSRT